MRPLSDIKVHDVYKNVITETEWIVLKKNYEEKMVLITMLSTSPYNKEIWVKNTDPIFNNLVYREKLESLN